MSGGSAILLDMYKNWNKFTHVCQTCDALIEYTSRRRVTDITCECGGFVCWVSEEPATIQPTNERNEMNTEYNPNALVTVKKIVDGESTYETIKVVDLEGMLFVNPTIDVIESLPSGEHITHQMKRTDIMELFRIKQYREARLASQESQIGQVLNNMTAEGWYNPNYEKQQVLEDLCEIFGYEPKQEIRITGTLNFDVRYDCPLTEIEDFDARYFLQDVLTLDSYNGDVVVDTFDVEDADVDWD